MNRHFLFMSPPTTVDGINPASCITHITGNIP